MILQQSRKIALIMFIEGGRQPEELSVGCAENKRRMELNIVLATRNGLREVIRDLDAHRSGLYMFCVVMEERYGYGQRPGRRVRERFWMTIVGTSAFSSPSYTSSFMRFEPARRGELVYG